MAGTSITGRILFILYMIVLHVLAVLFIREKLIAPRTGPPLSGPVPELQDTAISVVGMQQEFKVPNGDTAQLLMPVAGIRRSDLSDTYTQARSGGRVHNAIDIMAPAGTPVIAVATGEIAKFFDSEQGGITIYQWSADKQFVYYYAHLRSRAAGIAEGQNVQRGTTIGYVGDTGNAGTGNFHLHFSISKPTSPGRHWDGVEINPYPILQNALEVPARAQ